MCKDVPTKRAGLVVGKKRSIVVLILGSTFIMASQICPPLSQNKVWLFRGLTVSLSFLALLAIMEVALRILGIGYGNTPIVGHPIFHHWHPASYKCLAWGPHNQWGGFDLEFNADGCCMRHEIPPVNHPSILFLGDS